MFKNTTVKDKEIINISSFYIDANDDKNSFLSDELNIPKSYLIAYNGWHKIDGELYYYKNVAIFNEIFLSELTKYYNLKCVNYSIVYGKKGLGIISKNFREKNKTYYDYDDFFGKYGINIPNDIIILKRILEQILTEKNAKELMNTFFRLSAFDWFTGQTDRSAGNVTFDVTDQVSLCPLTDNGSSLHSAPKNNKTLYRILYTRLNSIYNYLEFPYNNRVNENNLTSIYLINNFEEFKKYLEISLDIDINEVLNRTIEKYNLLVPNDDRNELIDFFDTKRSILEKTLELSEKYKKIF